jgi:SAM-dependent methyltransferase
MIIWPFADLSFFYYELISKKLFLNNCDDVLDVGCGASYLTFLFSRKVSQINGVDISSSLIDLLKKNVSSTLNFEKFDVCSDHSIKKKYDKIYSIHAFEHLNDPYNALVNISKLLNENGKAILIFPNSKFHGIRYFENFKDLSKIFDSCNFDVKCWALEPSKINRIICYLCEIPKKIYKFLFLKSSDDSSGEINSFEETVYYKNINKTKYLRISYSIFIEVLRKILSKVSLYSLKDVDDEDFFEKEFFIEITHKK